MLEGQRRESFDHTAEIVATLANINRDTKKRPTPFHPHEFHPYRKVKRHEATPEEWDAMSRAMVKAATKEEPKQQEG